MMFSYDWNGTNDLVRAALSEDVGRGDVTTNSCVPAVNRIIARVVSRQTGVVAGLPVAEAVFRALDPTIRFTFGVEDGATVAPQTTLLTLDGFARPILTGERTALNFLGRLSGIATLTASCVRAIEGTHARVVDTRKTTPGMRMLEKYAVRVGGGTNHRFGLDDGILIKDNHIAASGGITRAVSNARFAAHHLLQIEVECDTLEQVHEALACDVNAILLDNMSVDRLEEAVTLIRTQKDRVVIEASGGIGTDPAKLRAVAMTGVDLISLGALTHTAPNFDVSLDVEPIGE